MSADLHQAIALITGSEPTREQIQRVMAIAHALEIPQSDPLLPFLAALDSYRGVTESAPEAMARAADRAASEAVERAGQTMSRAIERAGATMEHVAKKSVDRMMMRHATKWLPAAIGLALAAIGIIWLVTPSSSELARLVVRKETLEQRVATLKSHSDELRASGGDAQLAWCAIPHLITHDERIRCVRVDTKYGPFATSAGAIYYPIFGYAPK